MTELVKSSSDFIQPPSPVVSLIRSQKGKLMVAIDNYIFKLNQTTTTKYWKCRLAFHSCFNRRVQVHHPNIWSFIKVLDGEENHFNHMRIQFYARLGERAKQAKTIFDHFPL